MFVICDQNGMVQDIATEKANLSRGRTFTDFKLYIGVDTGNMQIGDTFKNGILVPNKIKQKQSLDLQINEQKIKDKIRQIAIKELKETNDLSINYK